jgi:mRNA-degrading endonuclease RelE of RelBE toxin-antitoxin system
MEKPDIRRTKDFDRMLSKLDGSLQKRLALLVEKIKLNPEIGKPMMYDRKGTRELYLKPFRLSYEFDSKNNIIVLLDLYHKKHQ